MLIGYSNIQEGNTGFQSAFVSFVWSTPPIPVAMRSNV
jgi:hypothetical protein